MKIDYKPGTTIVVADALLRARSQGDGDSQGNSDSDGTSITVEGIDVLQMSEADSTLQHVQTDQHKD